MRKNLLDHIGVIGISGYLQTWPVVSKTKRIFFIGKPLAKLLQWLCGKITGHELSETEHGTNGVVADCWCRWCDKMFTIPIEESPFATQWAPIIGQRIGGNDA